MSIQIFPKDKQGYGAFNGGQIVENKPIGFPQDHSSLRPYSNLFYWAHARAVTDSTIGLHPHQGFEICSFILKGPVRHFDTKLNDWLSLSAGDIQIIRSGNGISHSEFMGKDAEIFQIWFDPDLSKTLEKTASYDDYRSADFPVEEKNGVTVKTLAGPGSPFRMDTPGVTVQRIWLNNGATHTIDAGPGAMISAYLLEGAAEVNGETVKPSDFILAGAGVTLTLAPRDAADFFVIVSPADPGYRTYAQLRRAATH
jgi:redox-sensitive bicupin YhaK (pirin superfamily)